MVETLVKTIPAAPLLACLLIAIFGAKFLKDKSHWVAALGCAVACACSWACLPKATQPVDIELYRWMEILTQPGAPKVSIPIALHLDTLSCIMLSMLTFIATLVVIYASGYMHGDRGYWRFFSIVSLFVFSMIMLVLSANFVMLFMFWEAVGLCSYLLIGFWYEKPSAAYAGQKAFVVNRIGDFGFAIGIFLIWVTFGTVNFSETLGKPALLAKTAAENPLLIEAICLCLFAGAIGKSAQFPLMVWLPDAMEGPTPVSALIHAATMVTAGVYMVARCTPLYMLAPNAQLVISLVGGFTALLAALIALTQTDLKRVLAYSTVSQLGYMFLGLGAGSVVGIAGGMFHLFTHAFFKALLFLGAGSVMHAMGHVIDMQRFSGLRKLMPITYITFVIGSLALAGLFPLSGFWSKDTILAAVHHAAQGHSAAAPHDAGHDAGHDGHAADKPAAGHGDHPEAAHPVVAARTARLLWIDGKYWYQLLFAMGTFTAFLTAFYTFRAVFMTFHGPEKIPEEAGHHAHESPPAMTIPLIILAFGAAGIGLALGHVSGIFDGYLGHTIAGAGAHHEMDWMVAIVSTIVAVLGIGLAWTMYGSASRLPSMLASACPPLTRLSLHKFYLDEIYMVLFVLPLRGLAQLSRFLDWGLIDGAGVGLFTYLPREVGRLLRPLQNGLVQFYALSMMLAMAVMLAAILAW
ncbi:MAG: NADH-quinone oxidoreductase subunit L [Planctomycetales bacterium]